MRFLIPFLLTFTISNAQTTKHVLLHVDVLGQKKNNVRYYHPVEGAYTVQLNDYTPDKKTRGTLEAFTFINPGKHLEFDTSHFTANSLRYFVDPKELIYISWKMGYDSLNNQAKIDSFITESRKIRNSKYQHLVNEYFEPVWIGKQEVTNKDYHEFVDWVKDSIFREEIYKNDNPELKMRLTNDELAQMLNHPDKNILDETGESVFEISEPTFNRNLYSFNYEFDYLKKIDLLKITPLVSDCYRTPNQRFYNNKKIDVKNLNYRYFPNNSISKNKKNTIQNTNIYPDTTCWPTMRWVPNKSAFANMYFWHPAFNNYPVVGLSYNQIQAFIHWKQRIFEQQFPELAEVFYYDLPSVMDYEKAVSCSQFGILQAAIADDQVLTDLNVRFDPDFQSVFYINYPQTGSDPIEKTYMPRYESKRDYPRYWKKEMKKRGIDEELIPLSEEQIKYSMRANQNQLPGSIYFLSNNVSEWLKENYKTNYAQLFEAYMNYNCFNDIDYCQYQKNIDLEENRKNDLTGNLVMGSNWYDERYGSVFGVNTAGIYPKRFVDRDSSYATLGFRTVLRKKHN